MNKGERKLIVTLLILIVISSGILMYKIKREPKYDKELYNAIYEEYNNLGLDSNIDDKKTSNTSRENKIYIYKDSKGSYRVLGKISIPKINVYYPVIYETTDEYLKIAPTKLYGPNINEVGNFCIIGHNYKNEKFFSNLSKLENGDRVILTNNNGNSKKYNVYDKYKINENDLSCLTQETEGKVEVTLITCTNNKKERLVVKCQEEM